MKNRYYDTIFWNKQSNHQISKIVVDITVNCMRYNGKITPLVMILRQVENFVTQFLKFKTFFSQLLFKNRSYDSELYQISILREIYFSLTWDKNILILFLLLKYLPSRLHQCESPTDRKELFHENRNRKLVDQLHALPPFLKRTFFPLTDFTK